VSFFRIPSPRGGAERAKKGRTDTASVVEFSQKFTSIEGEIRSLGVDMKDGTVVEILFSVVPNKFLSIIGTIEQWGDLSTMSVAEAVGRLRVSEGSIKGRQQYKEEDEKLMLTRSQWEALSLKERKNGEGSDSKEGWHKGEYERKPYKKFDKSKIKCFNCSIYGHFASECCKLKKEKVNLIEKEEESVLLMHELMNTQEVKCDIETINEKFEELCMGAKVKTKENIWYLNLGASNHMMGCIEYLINLDTTI
jgi:hypothetical protein